MRRCAPALVLLVAGCYDFAHLSARWGEGDLGALSEDLAAPRDLATPADLGVVPSCNDKLLNNGETDVDCGGRNCARCAMDKKCLVGIDCTSLACVNGRCGSGAGLTLDFAPAVTVNHGKVYTSLVAADFNSDGRADVGAAGGNTFAALLGNGDGTLQMPRLTNVTPSCIDLAARDLNGDGAIDVALA